MSATLSERKNPNTFGATLLGLAGPPSAEQIVDQALAGNVDVLWVMGHNLVELFGEEKVRLLSERVGLFVFSGANQNPTAGPQLWTTAVTS